MYMVNVLQVAIFTVWSSNSFLFLLLLLLLANFWAKICDLKSCIERKNKKCLLLYCLSIPFHPSAPSSSPLPHSVFVNQKRIVVHWGFQFTIIVYSMMSMSLKFLVFTVELTVIQLFYQFVFLFKKTRKERICFFFFFCFFYISFLPSSEPIYLLPFRLSSFFFHISF